MKIVLLMSGLLLSGCVHHRSNGQRETVPWEDDLRKIAGLQLRCGPDALSITAINDRSAVVDGCGQRATYAWVNNDIGWGRADNVGMIPH